LPDIRSCKTGFERCAMQITIAIKVKLMKQSESETADDKPNHGRHEAEQEMKRDMNNEEKSESVVDKKQSADGTK
ncbi:hypothetical protein T06_10606, partial [Trichinella sp. T6]